MFPLLAISPRQVVQKLRKANHLKTHTVCHPGPDYDCINTEMAKFVASEQTCPCPPACEEKSYPASTSSAVWVAQKYKVGSQVCLDFLLLLQDTAASLYDMSEYTLEYDLLKVNVFYNSLMEKTITDEKDYDVTVCICMVGLL